MAALNSAPTPKQFANKWTAGFAVAVKQAAGQDGRLSRNEASKIAERTDALSRYGDNAVAYLERTGQASVSAEKLIGKGYNYAYALGAKVAGQGNRISLVEARCLPEDLRGDFYALRGKADRGAADAGQKKLTGNNLLDAIDNAAVLNDGTVLTYISEADYPVVPVSFDMPSGGMTAEGVLSALEDQLYDGLYEDLDDGQHLKAELYSVAETASQLAELSSPYEGADDYSLDVAAGFARLKDVLDANLTDVRMVRIGLPGTRYSMPFDTGLMAYALVGKTADGKVAGVLYGSVET